jgi:TonB family protein
MTTALVAAQFRRRLCLALWLFAVAVPPAIASGDPPIRVARLNYVERDVSFQPGSETDWSWAARNRPMTTGDSLWTGDRSRAEMHIGSTAIRMDEQTFMSFLNLDDRTVQIQLNSGTIDVRVRNLYRDDVFEVDTPNLAFTIVTRGDYRVTVDPEGGFTTMTLRDGQGQVTGGGQAFIVEGGSQVQVSGTEYVYYDTYDLPGRDDFDQWSYSRDLREDRLQSARYVSPELTGYEDLDQNGTWRTDRRYGSVWIPTRVSRGWAPYREGHWAWVGPWGWTWVDDAPFGFVTSHYGRWAYVDDGYGSRGWAWVPPRREVNQEVYARRSIYSPALVIFVGESNSPRGPEIGGRVAWFPLAPGEVYVPAYETSPTYITNVNITNTVVQQTTITNVVNNIVRTTMYVNQRVAGAVTVVPRATFVNAQPVARAVVIVAPSATTAAPVIYTAPVAPVRASVMGGGRPITAGAAAESAPPRPPEMVISRPVVAKVAPPPPPVAFAREQQALQADPGKPLDAKTEQDLRAASPQRAELAVRTAPPAPAVKPAEPSARRPQPATSPNKAQQARPSQRGGPPAVAEPPQATQQQLAAQKATQQAAQQQAAQQAAQQQAAQQAAQQQAAQQAAQQQAAQQAAQQQASQQQAAGGKAKQDAEQQQRAQQAAADKAKQNAERQQRAQQAAADKAAQQAARQTSQQQAEQQQAAPGKAQQAAAEKAKQDAAQQAADKARPQKVTEDRPPKSARNVKPPTETPPANQRAAASSGPIRVAENEQAARLLSQPKLNYPPDAKGARIRGTVRVHVLIGADGKVKTAAVLSGPQPLQAAALENARQRQYQPTMVGGQPVEVETDISIKF